MVPAQGPHTGLHAPVKNTSTIPYLNSTGVLFTVLLGFLVYAMFSQIKGEAQFLDQKVKWAQAVSHAEAECTTACNQLMLNQMQFLAIETPENKEFCAIGCSSRLNAPVKHTMCDRYTSNEIIFSSGPEAQIWLRSLGSGFCETTFSSSSGEAVNHVGGAQSTACLERQLTALLWCHAVDTPGDLVDAGDQTDKLSTKANSREASRKWKSSFVLTNPYVQELLNEIYLAHRARWQRTKCMGVCTTLLQPLVREDSFVKDCHRRCSRWANYPGNEVLCPVSNIPLETESTTLQDLDLGELYETIRLEGEPTYEETLLPEWNTLPDPLSAEQEEDPRAREVWQDRIVKYQTYLTVMARLRKIAQALRKTQNLPHAWNNGISCCAMDDMQNGDDYGVCKDAPVFQSFVKTKSLAHSPRVITSNKVGGLTMNFLGSGIDLGTKMCELVARIFCFAVGRVGTGGITDLAVIPSASEELADVLYKIGPDRMLHSDEENWPRAMKDQYGIVFRTLKEYLKLVQLSRAGHMYDSSSDELHVKVK
eukprot:Nk52_evm38s1485 gene=Nk52_evmTU38s1485